MFLRSLLVAALGSTSLYAAPSNELSRSVVNRYADIVYQTYADTLRLTRGLDQSINSFLAQPSAASLEGARKAWRAAHNQYSLTEAFRFYDGPIDGSYGVEGFVNSWPVDESYIDYVVGAPQAGIVNNPQKYAQIDADTLQSLHEVGGDTNVATGYHAVEFLLWGQDLSATGPGDRPVSDYLSNGDQSVERRRTYLRAASNLLVKQMEILVKAWDAKDPASYSSKFRQDDPVASLTKILKGGSSLLIDEVAGERMFTAFDSQSQEDEQSCFSDNTSDDLIGNVQGVVNVFTGDYAGVDGPGIVDLLAQTQPGLAKKVDAELNASLASVQALPKPFDSLIAAEEGSDERLVFQEAIFSVQDAGASLKLAAKALGVELPSDEK